MNSEVLKIFTMSSIWLFVILIGISSQPLLLGGFMFGYFINNAFMR